MKNILFQLVICCLIFSACKDKDIPDTKPIVPQPTVEEGREKIVFDYSIDTVKCDTAHFPDFTWNNGQPTLGIPPNPILPFITGYCINRQNEDEIFYSYYNLYLYKLNLLTKTRMTIPFARQPNYYSCNQDGWILFSRPNNVSKVKINGDSLTYLADGGATSATWNSDGSKFIFYPDLVSLPSTVCIADKNGNILDTIRGKRSDYFDWSKPDTFAYQIRDGRILGYNTKDRSQTLLVGPLGEPYGFCWLGDYVTMAVATSDGLYIFNTQTQLYRKIRCTGMYNSWYERPSYNRKQKRIFATKSQLLGPYQYVPTIVSMNIDGSDEKQVDIR